MESNPGQMRASLRAEPLHQTVCMHAVTDFYLINARVLSLRNVIHCQRFTNGSP